jgi:hypothetical protein
VQHKDEITIRLFLFVPAGNRALHVVDEGQEPDSGEKG